MSSHIISTAQQVNRAHKKVGNLPHTHKHISNFQVQLKLVLITQPQVDKMKRENR